MLCRSSWVTRASHQITASENQTNSAGCFYAGFFGIWDLGFGLFPIVRGGGGAIRVYFPGRFEYFLGREITPHTWPGISLVKERISFQDLRGLAVGAAISTSAATAGDTARVAREAGGAAPQWKLISPTHPAPAKRATPARDLEDTTSSAPFHADTCAP
eukprot:7834470-Pyramimonas_sp.AAC.1